MKTTRSLTEANTEFALECEIMLLAIDVHVNKYVVRRQMDGQNPQPSQTFRSEDSLLKWARKQAELAGQVYSVYEAGPLGFCLHRKLIELGIINHVIRPRLLNEHGSRRKNDQLDTLALVRDLDRYVRGNTRALDIVRVPTVEEELPRTRTRVRNKLASERRRLESHGRGLLLNYGHHIQGYWWKDSRWQKDVLPLIDPELAAILTPVRTIILAIEQQIQEATRRIEADAAPELPKGLGALSSQILEREIVDWNRFQKPRQVSSYTGLCPGEHSSGANERKLSITKEGNPAVRCVLVELAWRLIRFQPGYPPVREFCARHRQGRLNTSSARKRAVVMIARKFAVDWWKIRTGRARPEDFGLRMTVRQPA